MVIMKKISKRQDHFNSALKSKNSQIKQNGIPILISMMKPLKFFEISKQFHQDLL